MHPGLIVTEGLMGSGKSATAAAIALGLQHAGVPYRYWWEGERPHPIRVRDGHDGSPVPSAMIERCLGKWAALRKMCEASQVVGVLVLALT